MIRAADQRQTPGGKAEKRIYATGGSAATALRKTRRAEREGDGETGARFIVQARDGSGDLRSATGSYRRS